MIVSTQVRLITKEHLYRPLGSRILELGVQEMRMSSRDVISLVEQEGYSIAPEIKNSAMARQTWKDWTGKESPLITDIGFFSLLGIEHVSAMDIIPDMGADIIHDLNEPVPKSLHGQFDFIVDGGTFEKL